MKTVIYADVLLAVNFVIDYNLLLAAKHLCAASGGRLRLIAAAAVAAASALLLLAPPMPWYLAGTLKVVICVLCVRIAFAYTGLRSLARATGWYCLLNFLFAGVVFFALSFGGLRGVWQNNLAVYFDISPFLLLACVLGVYVILEIFELLFRPPNADTTIELELWLTPVQRMNASALYDTGFALKDIFSGTPAILISYPAVKKQLPTPLARQLTRYFEEGDISEGLHLVPYTTAGNAGVLPAVFGISMIMHTKTAKVTVSAPPIVFTMSSLAHGRHDALIGPELARQLI